jgi:hypothetical protein
MVSSPGSQAILAQPLSPLNIRINANILHRIFSLPPHALLPQRSGKTLSDHNTDACIIPRKSVLERPWRPDATIEPVVTEKAAQAHRGEPSNLEPTADDGSDKTDDGPDKKRSGESQFG